VEGFPLEDFSSEAVRNQIAEAQKVASGSGSEQDIAEAKIELEVRRGNATLPRQVANPHRRCWKASRPHSSKNLYIDSGICRDVYLVNSDLGCLHLRQLHISVIDAV
jgi:hypothetical protein